MTLFFDTHDQILDLPLKACAPALGAKVCPGLGTKGQVGADRTHTVWSMRSAIGAQIKLSTTAATSFSEILAGGSSSPDVCPDPPVRKGSPWNRCPHQGKT